MSSSYRWYHRLAAWLHDLIAYPLADLATPYWIAQGEKELEELERAGYEADDDPVWWDDAGRGLPF